MRHRVQGKLVSPFAFSVKEANGYGQELEPEAPADNSRLVFIFSGM
jgi:hypothetical protein